MQALKKNFLTLSNKTSKNLSLLTPFLGSVADHHFKYSFSLNWHGLNVTLKLQSESFLNELCAYFPRQWQCVESSSDLEVYLLDPQKLNLPLSFWQDDNPDCHTLTELNKEWACQRDFVAHRHFSQVVAALPNTVDDGFFNLMRWLLPRNWLSKDLFLFHSAAVLDDQGRSFLCLGPSGAGKSTISGQLPKERVLGDDMNLLRLNSDGQVYVTPSLLGQKYENQNLFGKEFPLHRVLWLNQSSDNFIESHHSHSFALKICSSLVNIFWQDLSLTDHTKIQKFIFKMKSKYSLENLYFSKSKNVWEEVFGFSKNI